VPSKPLRSVPVFGYGLMVKFCIRYVRHCSADSL